MVKCDKENQKFKFLKANSSFFTADFNSKAHQRKNLKVFALISRQVIPSGLVECCFWFFAAINAYGYSLYHKIPSLTGSMIRMVDSTENYITVNNKNSLFRPLKLFQT